MNPELLRNLWLEATPQRLVLVPAVLFSAAAILNALDPTGHALGSLSLLAFVLLTTVWGARQAANSVLDEARERTWDIQRMSALPAWPMTWGKLAGATVMSWYGGLCCLLVYAGSGQLVRGGDALLTVLLAICVALIAQAGALVAALIGMHRGRGVRARLDNLLVVLLLIWVTPRVLHIVDGDDTLRWYGVAFRELPFATITALVFAGWGLLGASRTMAIELKVVHRPGAWLGFIAFGALFATGFAGLAPTATPVFAATLLAALALVAGVAAYVAAFAWPSDAIQLRRVERALEMQDTRRLEQDMPLWTIAAGIALVAALAVTLLDAPPHYRDLHLAAPGFTAIALALMMIRDLLLLTWMVMSARPGQAESLTLLYLVLLDALLPALLPHLGLHALAPLVRPALFDAPQAAVPILALHCALVGSLGFTTYRRLRGGLSETAGG